MAVDMKTESRFAKKRRPEGLLPSHLPCRLEIVTKHLPVRSDVARPGMSKRGHTHIEGRLPSTRRIAPFAQRRWWRGRGPAGGERIRCFRDLVLEIRELEGRWVLHTAECVKGVSHGGVA